MENKVINKTGYYVSYNPSCFDHGKAETALCVDNPKRAFGTDFYILMGDWRKQFNDASDLEAAMKVFKDNREFIGPTSD